MQLCASVTRLCRVLHRVKWSQYLHATQHQSTSLVGTVLAEFRGRTCGFLLSMQSPFSRSGWWQLWSILHFSLTGQLNVALANSKREAMTSDLRLQIRTHIDSLESRDLSSQSAYGAEHICSTCTTPQAIETFLREVLGGLGHAGTQARRLRFRSVKMSGRSAIAVLFTTCRCMSAEWRPQPSSSTPMSVCRELCPLWSVRLLSVLVWRRLQRTSRGLQVI